MLRLIQKFALLLFAAATIVTFESCNKESKPLNIDGVWKKSSSYANTLGYAKVSSASTDDYETALAKFRAKGDLIDKIREEIGIVNSVNITGGKCVVTTPDANTYMGTVQITYDTDSYKAFILWLPEFVNLDGDTGSGLLELFISNEYIYNTIVRKYVTDDDEYNEFFRNIELRGILVYEK